MTVPKHEVMPDDHNGVQTIMAQGFHAYPTLTTKYNHKYNFSIKYN